MTAAATGDTLGATTEGREAVRTASELMAEIMALAEYGEPFTPGIALHFVTETARLLSLDFPPSIAGFLQGVQGKPESEWLWAEVDMLRTLVDAAVAELAAVRHALN